MWYYKWKKMEARLIIELNDTVEEHECFITAVKIKESVSKKCPGTFLDNWCFSSNVNFTMLEVIKPIKQITAPFICVIGYQTLWGSN